eukprot:3153511-Pleurochrysis_carterae.AAC.1
MPQHAEHKRTACFATGTKWQRSAAHSHRGTTCRGFHAHQKGREGIAKRTNAAVGTLGVRLHCTNAGRKETVRVKRQRRRVRACSSVHLEGHVEHLAERGHVRDGRNHALGHVSRMRSDEAHPVEALHT